jgi:hypothetical protein
MAEKQDAEVQEQEQQPSVAHALADAKDRSEHTKGSVGKANAPDLTPGSLPHKRAVAQALANAAFKTHQEMSKEDADMKHWIRREIHLFQMGHHLRDRRHMNP